MTKVIFLKIIPPKNLEIRQFIRIFAENLTHALFGLDRLFENHVHLLKI